MNVIMIRNGCMWVCMGTSGCTNTNLQANKTKKDRNRVAGYGREISPKRQICVCRHKEVRRDSGEWKWVRMGARGCIDTHQTQNKANRGTDRPAGRNFGKGMGGKLLKKDGT